MASRVDLDEVRRLCDAASDGPWETGVGYVTAGVAVSGDRFAEPGKCAYCHHGDPTWTGQLDINGGPVRGAHEHRVTLDLDDPTVYGGPDGRPKGVVIQGGDDFGPNLSPQDAAFIAAARTLVPELAAQVERLRADVVALLPAAKLYLKALDDDPEHEYLTLPEAMLVTALRDAVVRHTDGGDGR